MSKPDSSPVSLVWLRNDLRLEDNPALVAGIEAAGDHGAVVVVYVLEEPDAAEYPLPFQSASQEENSEEARQSVPNSNAPRPLGGASRWWLHHSLTALASSLRAIGGELVLRRGNAASVIPELAHEVNATGVYWNRRYTNARAVDGVIKSRLRTSGIDAHSFQANLLHEPWTVSTGSGTPFRVFTPYWRACLSRPLPRAPLPAPERITTPLTAVASDDLSSWNLLPQNPDWASGLRETWQPGEQAALTRLSAFLEVGLASYHRRDEPSEAVNSMLSPHLRFGEISPFQVWHAVDSARRTELSGQSLDNAAKFLSEIGWREFNASILFYMPYLRDQNVRPEFDAFPWKETDPHQLKAWQTGQTGVPLVDAGMRELWHTGIMHNRVRMVAASFLIKNLLVDWRIGEAWFWDTLVDADEASNPGNWQWVAGSGVDAAPYFRVFNPETQAKKFDPEAHYIQRWVPEFEGDAAGKRAPGAETLFGGSYPAPIVDLRETRVAALAAYDEMRAVGLYRGSQ
ncbi:deoxyribodipyrimidine photo-lyase [Leucobacter viscericola]|uniref:Deoxyribodipyrimidine photo-lyase n=1 Tax=Leucobacter viscericola TaxID=2714935 RepID=A0A6G7XBJ9_9MICO|nr:deoxyribodipyrimidine photo-lyase [Leucobacter viscericola]QIK61980.1 deoxyribodipyrimidine photo-lyase [Leucobacter viscericola]